MAESSTITREPPVSTTPVPILYVNWRGETSVRRIVPGPTWFGSTEWHPEPQWLMTADEPDTGKRRDFALAGIKAWGQEAVDMAGWRARGEPDPHGDRYDCPRERLCGGQLTDDQVAFQTAMLMRTDLNHEAVLAVAKDRIRWLSRRVVALEAAAAAMFGSKRRPHYSSAALGLDGMGANLRLSDGSLELVFKDEELDLINEEGRDLYISRLAASEVIHLRQWLIDFLPASEAEISAGHGVAPPVSVTVPAPGTEERLFWLEAAEQHGFEATSGEEELPAFNPPAYLATEDEVLKLMAAAREQGRKDVLDALATGGARG